MSKKQDSKKCDHSDVNWDCADCGVCTNCISEYYMLTNDLWLEIWGQHRGYLCIGCVEDRLGRKLQSDDFNHSSLTEEIRSGDWRASDRLLDRITE